MITIKTDDLTFEIDLDTSNNNEMFYCKTADFFGEYKGKKLISISDDELISVMEFAVPLYGIFFLSAANKIYRVTETYTECK